MVVNADPRCASILNDSSGVFVPETGAGISVLDKEGEGFFREDVESITFYSSWVMIALTILHLVLGTMYFRYNQNKYIRLRNRNIFLVIDSAMVILIIEAGNFLTRLVWYPCWTTYTLAVLVAPLIGSVITGRLIAFITKSVFQSVVNATKIHQVNEANSVSTIKSLTTLTRQVSNPDNQSRTEHAASNINDVNERTIKRIRFLAKNETQFCIFFVVMLPFVFGVIGGIYSLEFLNPDANCFGCGIATQSIGVIGWSGGALCFLSLSLAYYFRNFDDNLGMRREVVYMCFAALAMLGSFLLVTNIKNTELDFFYLYWFTYNVFFACGTELQVFIAKWEEKKIIQSNNNHQNNKLASVNVSPEVGSSNTLDNLEALLKKGPGSDNEYEQFSNFIAAEFASENLRMWEEANRYQQMFPDMNEATRKSRAKKIVKLFIMNDSVFYVNIPATMRAKVIEASDNPTSDLFEAVQNEMFHMLSGTYLRFNKKKSNSASAAIIATTSPS